MKKNIILGTSNYKAVEGKGLNTVSVGGDGGLMFGYFGNSYKKLGPKLETFIPYAEKYNKLHDIKKYLSNDDYKLYRKEMEDEYIESYYNIRLKDLNVDNLLKLFNDKFGNNIVLLCHEPVDEFCHRRLIADYIEIKTGIYIPEIEIEKGKIKELKPIKYIDRLKKVMDK